MSNFVKKYCKNKRNMLGIYLYFNFVVNFFVLLNLIYYGFKG